MLLRAGKDEKYQVVKKLDSTVDVNENGNPVAGYMKLDDVEAFRNELVSGGLAQANPATENLSALNINKSADDIDELYVVPTTDKDGKTVKGKYFLVNTSGKVIDSKSRNKDGNDYYYTVDGSGKILAIYTEK